MIAETARKPDLLTLACIAIIAYALAALLHEGVGHGGACLLTGCQPHLLTSMSFDGDASQLSRNATRLIAAGGSLVNLLTACIGFGVLRRLSTSRPAGWFFCWLLATISLLQATGYLLFSGLGGVGDWADVVSGLPGGQYWRVLLAVVGGICYWLAVRYSMQWLAAHLSSSQPGHSREAYGYLMPAYFTGGALGIIAGLLDPNAGAILLISGMAASLGGTSGLLWGPQLMRDPAFAAAGTPLAPLRRHWSWVVAGALVAAAHVLLLGPGLRF